MVFKFYYLQANYHASSSFQTCVTHCKEKRGLMKSTKEFWSKKQFTDSSSMEQWMKTKQRIGEYSLVQKKSCMFEFPPSSHPLT